MYSSPIQFKTKVKSSLSLFTHFTFIFKIFLFICCLDSIVHASWIIKNEREFTLRNGNGIIGDNIYGDFNVTGAPIICIKDGNKCNWNYTGMLADADTLYLTEKTPQIPLNSSSAALTIPSDAVITRAYLYWSGHIHGTIATQEAYQNAIAGYNSVILRTPDGNDHTITTDVNDATKVNFYAYLNDTVNVRGYRHFYQAMADVTDIVKNGGYAANKKEFTVGNIKTNQGEDDAMYEPEVDANNIRWGNMGGWALVVQYERPIASGQTYKNVSIYDGFKFLLPPTNQTESIDINISGFLTPLTQIPTGSMAFYAMGSEKKLTGETAKISNKNGTLQDLFNSINPIGGVLNDSISIFGNNLNATRIFNPGIDLDVFDIKNSCKNSGGATVACIDSNQTSTTIQLSVKNNNNTSDQSFPGMIAFSVDIYQPDISSFSKDSNTTSTQILYPGNYVKYTLDLNNSGTEAAENITIYDTFSSSVGGDMLLDIIDRNATAIKNSIRLKTYAEANYHCAIGSTDPECALLAQDANCSVDYEDNNLSKAKKVWCNIPYMAVDDRNLMQFTIKIRDDYNQSLAEQNVTNIAYSHYYNAATHEEITVEGKSNIHTAGVVGGMIPYNSFMDTVDAYDNTYDYNVLTGLKTKIANSNNNILEAVYLGDNPSNPQPSIYTSPSYDMLVLFRLSNNTCTDDNNISDLGDVTATFSHGGNQYTAVSNAFTLVNKAKKNAKIKMHFIDWNKLSLDIVGNNCTHNSSITGNLKGVPQCLNGNEDKIDDLVTVDVTECITPQGSYNAPCDSEAYNASGSKGNIFPFKYNNTYGCLMCLSDKVNSNDNCSRDNFAIRPNNFDSTITTNQLFTAEQNTSITFRANQFNGIGTIDYNETMNTSFVVDINISDSDKNCSDPFIGISPNIAFLNGQVTNNYIFDNVGDFNITIHEVNASEFAIIDNDDTPDNDRLIVPFLQQIRIIPASFAIDSHFENRINGFTYLSNFEVNTAPQDRNMSAILDLNISALGASGTTILSNYTSTCYAKDGNISLILPSVLNISPSNALTKLLWFDELHPDVNGTEAIMGTSYVLDMNHSQFDTLPNGSSQMKYRMNFDRNTTVGSNPFTFSIQTLSAINEDSVSGIDAPTGSATFYYGRAHAPDYRFANRDGNATIYYEVYCKDCNATFRNTMGITGNESVNALNWYQNALHVNTSGIVTPQPAHSADFTTFSTTHPDPVSVERLTLKSTTDIPYVDRVNLNSNTWLVHYPTYFTVEFYSTGSWAGAGFVKENQPNATDTNTTVGEHIHKSAPTKAHKRLNW